MWVVFCCCVRRGTYVKKSRRSRANFQNAPRRHRDARGSRRGGSIRPLKLLSRLLSEIICRRHFVVESMRRRAGERGGWRERNIQTEGNVSGGGGRRRGEGYLGKEKWGVNGPTWVASTVDVLSFFSSVWATAPSSLRNRWHNAEEADWSFKLGGSQRKAEFELTLHPSRHQKLYFLLHW